MDIDRICTCTPNEREQAFNLQIDSEVNSSLLSYTNHLNKELDRELRKHRIESDLKNYELIFKLNYLELQNANIILSYPPNFNRNQKDLAIGRMREFHSMYIRDHFKQFKDYHKAECILMQSEFNENGNEYNKPKHYPKFFGKTPFFKHHAPYEINYFFYLRLKEYYTIEYTEKLIENEVETKKNDLPYEITLSEEQQQRTDFFEKIKTDYNFHVILDKYKDYAEQIKNDIIECNIPYLFALFEHFGYRDILEKRFRKKNELNDFLFDNLDESKNDTDLRKFWKCLDQNSAARKDKFTPYNSFTYLKDLQIKYPKV
jgi:hypothetical protein